MRMTRIQMSAIKYMRKPYFSTSRINIFPKNSLGYHVQFLSKEKLFYKDENILNIIVFINLLMYEKL